jgi:hypothetical protein
MRTHKIESARKNALVEPTSSIRLSENAKAYLDQFFLLAGYSDVGLPYQDREAVFKMLSRVEELETLRKHHGHNWELIYGSIPRLRQAYCPIIEENILKWAQKGFLVSDSDLSCRWPENRPFALCLTHDIDELFFLKLKARLRAALPYRKAPLVAKMIYLLSLAKEALKTSVFWRKGEDPPMEIWLETEQQHGFASSMFFLPDKNSALHWEDNFYRYDDSIRFAGKNISVGDLIKTLADKGIDIGLHGSVLSHADTDILMKQKHSLEKAVGRSVVTTRQHGLFYDIRYTPICQQSAGFLADSSIGSNIISGYRVGTGLPFFHFDYLSDTFVDLLQSPLIIQDVALFRSFDMNEDLAVRHCLELLETAAKTGGALTLLWHNDYFPNDPPFRAYAKILQKAAEMGAWGCSLKDINNWWRSRRTALVS